METIRVRTVLFDIKQNGKWSRVRATGIKALAQWSKTNNVQDWVVVGIISRKEMEESQSLPVVA